MPADIRIPVGIRMLPGIRMSAPGSGYRPISGYPPVTRIRQNPDATGAWRTDIRIRIRHGYPDFRIRLRALIDSSHGTRCEQCHIAIPPYTSFQKVNLVTWPPGTLLPKNLSSSRPGASLIHFDFMLKPRPFLRRTRSQSGAGWIL